VLWVLLSGEKNVVLQSKITRRFKIIATCTVAAFAVTVQSLDTPLLKNTGQYRSENSISIFADRYWFRIALNKTLGITDQLSQIRDTLQTALIALSRIPGYPPIKLPGINEEQALTDYKYGVLPEVYVDQELGAIFPQPVPEPNSFSWFNIFKQAENLRIEIDKFQTEMEKWSKSKPTEQINKFGEIATTWLSINEELLLLTSEVRYLRNWVPKLQKQKGFVSTANQRPFRVQKPPYLPDNIQKLKGQLITIPIATDIKDKKFIKEIEGALDTHWNQSFWARQHQVRFKINWRAVVLDKEFQNRKIDLDTHLQKFPKNIAVITTGGLTTHVKGVSLILGPGKLTPRTLAHELGHLLGFGDCYLRTLSRQDLLGILGTSVLEINNHYYPDDLMCDNTVGSANYGVW